MNPFRKRSQVPPSIILKELRCLNHSLGLGIATTEGPFKYKLQLAISSETTAPPAWMKGNVAFSYLTVAIDEKEANHSNQVLLTVQALVVVQ